MAQPHSTERVVILGAGLAALTAALRLAPHPVLVISPDPLGVGASSAWAQGGVAAAMDPGDSAENHAADTIRAGAGIVDPDTARSVTAEAQAHIHELTRLGAPFDRSPNGDYILSQEAAHGFARVVRVKGDQAGAEITRTLITAARATPSIQIIEGLMAIGLHLQEGRVAGVRLTDAVSGDLDFTLLAPAVLLAGGGSGGLFSLTTNPGRITGQALGMAAREGAQVADAEFVQFHPTAINCGQDPAPLATEALRGAGAHLINSKGERFMTGVHPDAELAPRDIVARAIYAQTQAGLNPMLDTRQCLGPRIRTEFPFVSAACASHGIDPVHDPIPVAAAAHYHMGGVATDAEGRSSLPGLWVAGEAASTGLHGANRLASNGLLEALVFGSRAAGSIRHSLDLPVTSSEFKLPAGKAPASGSTQMPDPALVVRLRRAMTDGAGVIRDHAGLISCLREIALIEAAQPRSEVLLNMTATATLIAASALLRRESRGAHFRSDFPNPLAASGQRSMTTLAQAQALRATFQEK